MFSLPNLNLNTFHNHKTTKWNVYFYNFFSKIIYSLHTLYNRPLCFYFTYLTNVYTYFTTFGRHFFFFFRWWTPQEGTTQQQKINPSCCFSYIFTIFIFSISTYMFKLFQVYIHQTHYIQEYISITYSSDVLTDITSRGWSYSVQTVLGICHWS